MCVTLNAADADTMDKWDEAKLREVVTSKRGNPRTTTDVRVCVVYSVIVLMASIIDRVQVFHRSHRISEVCLGFPFGVT